MVDLVFPTISACSTVQTNLTRGASEVRIPELLTDLRPLKLNFAASHVGFVCEIEQGFEPLAAHQSEVYRSKPSIWPPKPR